MVWNDWEKVCRKGEICAGGFGVNVGPKCQIVVRGARKKDVEYCFDNVEVEFLFAWCRKGIKVVWNNWEKGF